MVQRSSCPKAVVSTGFRLWIAKCPLLRGTQSRKPLALPGNGYKALLPMCPFVPARIPSKFVPWPTAQTLTRKRPAHLPVGDIPAGPSPANRCLSLLRTASLRCRRFHFLRGPTSRPHRCHSKPCCLKPWLIPNRAAPSCAGAEGLVALPQ